MSCIITKPAFSHMRNDELRGKRICKSLAFCHLSKKKFVELRFSLCISHFMLFDVGVKMVYYLVWRRES